MTFECSYPHILIFLVSKATLIYNTLMEYLHMGMDFDWLLPFLGPRASIARTAARYPYSLLQGTLP